MGCGVRNLLFIKKKMFPLSALFDIAFAFYKKTTLFDKTKNLF